MTFSSILIFHIIAGTISLLSGATALVAQKGTPIHKSAGKVFVISMVCMCASGVAIASIKMIRLSVVAGVLTLYMVATSWMAVKRKPGETGRFELIAMLVVFANAGAALFLALEVVNSELGYIDNIKISAEPYFFFAAVSAFAGTSDLVMILKRGLAGMQRIMRHLWRMCFALYIATSSLFLGNPQVFPEVLVESGVTSWPVYFVLALSLFWLIRVRFFKTYRPVQRLRLTQRATV